MLPALMGKSTVSTVFLLGKKQKKLPLSPAPASPVQQLLFSGVTMAVICRDHSVSFYNLIEYQQLGQTTLKGQADSSLLYDCHFLVQTFQSKEKPAFISGHQLAHRRHAFAVPSPDAVTKNRHPSYVPAEQYSVPAAKSNSVRREVRRSPV